MSALVRRMDFNVTVLPPKLINGRFPRNLQGDIDWTQFKFTVARPEKKDNGKFEHNVFPPPSGNEHWTFAELVHAVATELSDRAASFNSAMSQPQSPVVSDDAYAGLPPVAAINASTFVPTKAAREHFEARPWPFVAQAPGSRNQVSTPVVWSNFMHFKEKKCVPTVNISWTTMVEGWNHGYFDPKHKCIMFDGPDTDYYLFRDMSTFFPDYFDCIPVVKYEPWKDISNTITRIFKVIADLVRECAKHTADTIRAAFNAIFRRDQQGNSWQDKIGLTWLKSKIVSLAVNAAASQFFHYFKIGVMSIMAGIIAGTATWGIATVLTSLVVKYRPVLS